MWVAALDCGGNRVCRRAARHQAGIERVQCLGAARRAVGAVRHLAGRLHAAPRRGALAAHHHDAVADRGGGVGSWLLGVRDLEDARSFELLALVFASVFSLVGHLFVIYSLRSGEMAAVAPFRYAGILWAILLGLLIWNQLPDALSLAGICDPRSPPAFIRSTASSSCGGSGPGSRLRPDAHRAQIARIDLLRHHAQHAALRAVGQQPERAVGARAHVADALAEVA